MLMEAAVHRRKIDYNIIKVIDYGRYKKRGQGL